MRVLIVDDQPHNVLLLETLLEQKYETIGTNNGYNALEIIEKDDIDIVLLDVLMPQIDGFEVLKKIKGNNRIKEPKVIMVTCKTDISDIKHALQIGASDYIKKPVDSTELYSKLKTQEKLILKQKQVDEYQVYANIHETMILAKHLQYSLLPDKDTFKDIFPKSFVMFLPRDIVSGDIYFSVKINGKIFFALIDSASHGVPAAMLSIMTYMILNDIVIKQKITSPEKVAYYIHTELKQHLYKSKDIYNQIGSIDALFCEYNEESKQLNYVSARRPLALIRDSKVELEVDSEVYEPTTVGDNNSLYILNGGRKEIAIDHEIEEFDLKTVSILPNDTVYLYSDGYTDQIGGYKNKRFSKKQFHTNLLSFQDKNMKDQKLELYNLYADWSLNYEQTDDILILGIRF
jgi:CheY-like chemotaxis protein